MSRSLQPRGTSRESIGLPWWVLLLAGLGAAFLVLPLVGLLSRVSLAGLPRLLASEASLAALGLSLRTSAASALLCVVLGVPLALALARVQFPGRRVLRAVVLLPLVLPPVVGGIALLATYGRRGLFGIDDLAFTTAAVVVAQTFVALPFMVISLEGALQGAGTDYERVASALGAGPTRTLFTVTMPMLAPSIGSGLVLSFARALGEFGATLTFAGSLQGTTRTLPLEIYLQREVDPDAAAALSVLLMAVALVIVLVAYRSSRTARGGLR